MNEILVVTMTAMQADTTRLNQLAANLANAATPGYKRGIPVQAPLRLGFAQHLDMATGSSASGDGAVAAHRDMRTGSLRATGAALDVALTGPGYFEVMTEAGLAYTRQGSFRIDAAGRLVTLDGAAVQGEAGDIAPGAQGASITRDGEVRAVGAMDGRAAARIRIVDLGQQELHPAGAGLFRAAAAGNVLPAGRVQLQQGFLENSNVETSQEMTSLVQTMRHFETMHKVTQGVDDMLGAAIRKLGDPA